MHSCLASIKPSITCRILGVALEPTAISVQHTFWRSASLTSAIAHGIRKSQGKRAFSKPLKQNETSRGSPTAGRRQDRPPRQPPTPVKVNAPKRIDSYRHGQRTTAVSHKSKESLSRDRRQGTGQRELKERPVVKSSRREEKSNLSDTSADDRVKTSDPRAQNLPRTLVRVPLSIPYTTPASEFLYGRYAVEAALKSERRKLYQLYMMERLDGSRTDDDQYLYKLALAANVPVKRVEEDWDKLLNKMSDRRPHNGYVLEASPLPNMPVIALTTFSQDAFAFALDHQSSEEATINGTNSQLPNLSRGKRYPFLLMLDRILDPGNLGAIIRTATYYGVDAVMVIQHGTAPFSAATLKASAGSAESMALMKIRDSVQFMKTSQANGWRFFAAVAPDSVSAPAVSQRATSASTFDSALNKHPCVLILGEEGSGIQPRIQKSADSTVSIERFGSLEAGIESLNVSVAAALLCDRFIRGSMQPKTMAEPLPKEKLF